MSETEPKRRRGRPPIDAKITTVRLPPDVLQAIDQLCGEKRRGQFIRDAVEEKLGRAAPGRAEPPAPATAEPKPAKPPVAPAPTVPAPATARMSDPRSRPDPWKALGLGTKRDPKKR